ncbi:MAG TPA: cation-transporting P-type ATPase [Gammaproteobacteria bacterium]|nr:cation-transporting P-type ATPase [Gammaproteobacteria bacterium]
MDRAVPDGRLTDLLRDGGLDDAEVEERRLRFGTNDVVERSAEDWRHVVRDTLKDPMVWFLAFSGLLFSLVGNYGEAAAMLIAIVPLAAMDAFLHRRASASAQALRDRIAERACVIRGGTERDVRAAELVPGDLAVVRAGQWFPADGVIVAADGLQVDESTLTGESFPVHKSPPAARSASLDTAHWGFAGTRLLTGTAKLRVLSTAGGTLYGQIVRAAASLAHAPTPLQRAIAALVRTLLAAALVFCLALAWVRLRQGHGLVDAALSAVTLAVAAIPEEFPIVFTFFLGVGIFRLARRHALVRRAVVVENIGRVSYICTDKTGTLTEGRLRVAHWLPANGVTLAGLQRTARLAARADSGDPLDAAILDASTAPNQLEPLATFPFTEERRRETRVYRDARGSLLAASKGAPETIFDLCRLSAAERDAWEARAEQLAAKAHKVIACASCELGSGPWDGSEPGTHLRFDGLLGCGDPLRAGAAEAVRVAQEAGVRVLMITGDHAVTAAAIAREAGIGGAAPRVALCDEVNRRLHRDGAESLRSIDVVARALPAEKLRLVRALQDAGEVVAVTGDGVNDVPALQAADVSIAMGERGTRSAREAASIVLLDDNFRTIVRAIAEGRQLMQNLRQSFAYLLMVHIPLVTTAAWLPLAGYPLLYLPIHIVWLELVIHPTALLVFQERAGTRMRALEPRQRRARFFALREWALIAAVGAALAFAIAAGFERALANGAAEDAARAVALVTLVIGAAAVTASLSALRTVTARVVVLASVLSAIVLVQVPAVAVWLHLAPVSLQDWALAAAAGAAPGALAGLLRRARPRTAAAHEADLREA